MFTSNFTKSASSDFPFKRKTDANGLSGVKQVRKQTTSSFFQPYVRGRRSKSATAAEERSPGVLVTLAGKARGAVGGVGWGGLKAKANAANVAMRAGP